MSKWSYVQKDLSDPKWKVPKWLKVIKKVYEWLRIINKVPKWPKVIENVSKWLEVIKTMLKWPRVINKVSKWPKIINKMPQWPRVIKNVSKWSKKYTWMIYPKKRNSRSNLRLLRVTIRDQINPSIRVSKIAKKSKLYE